jgi:NADPH:quinone reductase-like Zn-dependent oxidoreductase
MRAVGLFTHGGPEVLQVVEVPEVHAAPGQVRIRVHAATVNPTDVMVRNGSGLPSVLTALPRQASRLQLILAAP